MDPLLHEFLGIGGNEYPTTNKTEEEIKRLTLEEDMNEVKRTVHILFRGQPIQKPAIYLNVHKILLEPDAFLKIMPMLAEGIMSQNEETQIEAAKGFIKLIKNNSLDINKLLDIFNLTINVVNIWSQPVLDAWVVLFEELLHLIPYDLISEACESSIDMLSEQSQHPSSQYVAARMTGILAENGIKPTKPLFDRMRFLCQDSDVEVRRVLAEEVIVKICRNVGSNLTEHKYLEKLLELIYDSDTTVKLSAIDSVVEILDLLSLSFRKSRMVQVLVELMHSFNEDVMKKMSFLVGKVFYKLEDIMLEDQSLISQIEKIIKEWLSHKNHEIKRNIIYNIPYLIKVLNQKTYFKDLYFKATRDHDAEIRKIAMSSFHDIIKAFELKEAQITFKDTFEVMLREEDTEILEKIIAQLPEVLPKFQPNQEEDAVEETNRGKEDNYKGKYKENVKWKEYKDADTDKSGQSTKVNSKESLDQKSYLEDLIGMGNLLNKKHAWRLEILFMETMNKCINYFDLKDYGEVYVNFLIKEIERGNKNIRKSAVDNLILFLKRNHYINKTNDTMKKIVDQFPGSQNYQGRLAFLEFFESCAENFSRQFFKVYNLNEIVLGSAQDKVVEVRKKFLQIAVSIRKMIDSEDKAFLNRFEAALLKNITDQNKTVSTMAKGALKDIKSLTKHFFDEFNVEDAARFKNEEQLKEKEKEEIDANKRKQQEEVLKGRTEHLKAALGTLILGGKRVLGKKTIWTDNNANNVSRIQKGSQSATLCLTETPKCKPATPLLQLPALKTQKNPTSATQIQEKESDRPRMYKARIPKHLMQPIGQTAPKKKNGSICLEPKEKSQIANVSSLPKEPILERNSSKGKYLLTEPAPRHSLDIRPNKLGLARDSIERSSREKVTKIPIMKKKA